MEYVDLRSDTVTKPTPEMREAMAEAEVGDDVFGDDPTVNRLEEIAAGMMGKEAALFVPSGTMGNLIALLVHCQRGDEVIVGNQSHIYLNEAGGMSALGGIQPCPVQNQKDGTLALDDILDAIRSEDVHHPITRLICLENTQNVCGGVPLTPEYTRQVGEIARSPQPFPAH
jgi:threonine aldolase